MGDFPLQSMSLLFTLSLNSHLYLLAFGTCCKICILSKMNEKSGVKYGRMRKSGLPGLISSISRTPAVTMSLLHLFVGTEKCLFESLGVLILM